MRLRHAIAIAALFATASPAHAQENTVRQEASIQYAHVSALGGMNVALECVAVSTPTAIHTRVSECFLRGRDDGLEYPLPPSGGRPLNADVVHGVLRDLPVQEYERCVRAWGAFTDLSRVWNDLVCD